MASTWPILEVADLASHTRTYINEATAAFFTDAEIYRWLSIAAKDIAQKTLCVRRILDAHTAASTRTVATNAYKVINVEYYPASDRPIMLVKIDSPKVIGNGNYIVNGTKPQFWYEFGNTIGIEPKPDAEYDLRLYVADTPKIKIAAITDFTSGWTGDAVGEWTLNGSGAAYSGTDGGTLTYGTAMASGSIYTLEFVLTAPTGTATIVPGITTAGTIVNTVGPHTQTITAGGTSLVFTVTASGASTISITSLNIFQEIDYSTSTTTANTELDPAWQHPMILYATAQALYKDKRVAAGNMVESMYNNELEYLKQNLVDIIPDSLSSLRYR